MGYADAEGFRCGTCHPFRPFDIGQDLEMNLWEYPLIVMDATLLYYRQMSPEQAVNIILKLAVKCKNVGGTFTLLWHNTSLFDEWEPWVATYQQVLYELAELVQKD